MAKPHEIAHRLVALSDLPADQRNSVETDALFEELIDLVGREEGIRLLQNAQTEGKPRVIN